MDDTLRALNRFGLGARIGDRMAISDPRGWLREQVATRSTAGLAAPVGGIELGEVSDLLRRLREAQRSRDQSRIAGVRGELRRLQVAESAAMLNERARSRTPYVERLVAFWSNHLCVSVAAKPQVAALAGHYERTAIRPHVMGRFEDMVLASAKHPAMLFYLDNFQSIGPGSAAGRRTARRGNARGLNENHARELLELHTLGVDGGYDQGDVEAMARVLTGWSVAGTGPGARADEPLGFTFRPLIHQPGSKTVLGKRYGEAGVREGEQVIHDLCAHPSTAVFVSTKLVRHFVSDEPSPAAVETIATVFRDSGGDLRSVAEALIDLDEAWRAENVKFRTPQDWLIAAFRAFGMDEVPEQTGPLLRQLRHTPWAPAAPKGYGDLQREWADPDSLMNRAELARTLAGRIARGRRVDPRRLLDVVDVGADDPLRTLLDDSSIPAPERVALVIGGPAFQWR